MTTLKSLLISIVFSLSLASALQADPVHQLHTFQRLQLTDQFYSEGATAVDVNRDGHADLVAGPYWYAGPDFTERTEYYEAKPFSIKGYSDNFFVFGYDFNGDEWQDILVIGFPGKEAFWYENPQGKPGHWTRHLAFPVVENESPTFADLTGDGQPELVFHTAGRLGYAEIPSDDPTKVWQFQPISPDRGYKRFEHGLGVGDLNGDGRPDLLEKRGWWEHPAGDPAGSDWAFHPMAFAKKGGAQMLVYDLDNDGDNDIITSEHAHSYGLVWFENFHEHNKRVFRKHLIMGRHAHDNDYGVAFSQLHAVALADIDGDGVKDIVTGKRFWAHKGIDAGSHDPAVSYWFQTVREKESVRFIPHRIDTNSGVGTQIVVGDLNNDQLPDLIVGNKKGTFALLHHVKQVDHKTWEKSQPIRLTGQLAGSNKAAAHDHAHSHAHDDTKKSKASSKQLDYPFAGLTASQSVKEMILPEGFTASVFASEPDIRQPIAMTLDDRGRVWVAEAYSYPSRAPEGTGRDRILIFEDTDGDGHFDTRKIFAEGLNLISGLEVGFGGVWVGAAPYLMFIPDRDGDDIPDSKPEVLLDGWGFQDTHETLNAFIWGPDGWLYGCHGVFTHSQVGRPGTPDKERTGLNAGIWRYHPTRHEFEVFAHGTSNPWGLDFDDRGQAVATACVIPHLFHIVQGARYQRQSGQHFNKHTYDDIKTIADHLHYIGKRSYGSDGRSDSVGGGHAHAGAMIYQGGVWPDKYRDQIIMNNIHGQRLNADILVPSGSGFIGSHGPDFLLTKDLASQMLYFRYGPDGQVYVIDWYDMQACHSRNIDKHDRSNGRIYKIAYGKTEPVTADLRQSSDLELAEMVLNKNDWYVRHSRRLLQERAADHSLSSKVIDRLTTLATTHADATRRLRAVWVLHVTGELKQPVRDKMLSDSSPHMRSWALQLALENAPASDELLQQMAQMARTDTSPVVRLYLTSALQRLGLDQRWEILAALASHAEDVNDHNLPYMIWYAAEPLAKADPARALQWALSPGMKIPRVRNFLLRRVSSLASPKALAAIMQALQKTSSKQDKTDILRGLQKGLTGHVKLEPPQLWESVYPTLVASDNETLQSQAMALGVKFGDPRAMEGFREILKSDRSSSFVRQEAMASLLSANDPKLVPTLLPLLSDPGLREPALAGLARYEDPQIPPAILKVYPNLPLDQKRVALSTLTSRESYALVLLKAVAEKQLPATDISADLVRQLHNLKNDKVDQWVASTWGQMRTTAEDKLQLIKHYKKMVSGSNSSQADISLGRAVFAKTCQQCHKLYGVGNTIGPDLTGSNRRNLDYLLANIVDPSGVITKEYQATILYVNGRAITGVVSAEDDQSVTLRNATETVVVPKDEIEERVLSDVSLMPENQLKQYSKLEIISLIAYLRTKRQGPMLATPENASQLFNGLDLAGWSGDKKFWSVEDGEIVGKTSGIKRNTFLSNDLTARDFRLALDVKLVDNLGNSGIQFRSRLRKGQATSVAGYQADIGKRWWGKLFEEHGRGILWEKSGESHVKLGEWNHYEILADGSKVQTWINGQLCVDLDDPAGQLRGIFALQLHSGGPTEVRFKNFKLEVLNATSAPKPSPK